MMKTNTQNGSAGMASSETIETLNNFPPAPLSNSHKEKTKLYSFLSGRKTEMPTLPITYKQSGHSWFIVLHAQQFDSHIIIPVVLGIYIEFFAKATGSNSTKGK